MALNISTFVFGNLAAGYTQSPWDNQTKEIFTNFLKYSTTTSQVLIHRDGSLIYYGYTRKLANNQIFGLCFAVNGVYFPGAYKIFRLFEKTIEEHAEKEGKLICLDEQGGAPISLVKNLNDYIVDCQNIGEEIKERVNNISSIVRQLPPINYGEQVGKCNTFTFESPGSEIACSSYSVSYTVVTKDVDIFHNNSSQIKIRSLNEKIRELNGCINNLNSHIDNLKNANAKLSRQKKRLKLVVFLCLLLIAGSAGLYLLYDKLTLTESNLEYTNEMLNEANTRISEQESTISDLSDRNKALNSTINSQKSKINRLEEDLDAEKERREQAQETINDVANISPIIISSHSFNKSSGYLTLRYYSVVAYSTSLKFIVKQNGSTVTSTEHQFSGTKGNGQSNIFVTKSLDKTQSYDLEIWYSNKLVRSFKV